MDLGSHLPCMSLSLISTYATYVLNKWSWVYILYLKKKKKQHKIQDGVWSGITRNYYYVICVNILAMEKSTRVSGINVICLWACCSPTYTVWSMLRHSEYKYVLPVTISTAWWYRDSSHIQSWAQVTVCATFCKFPPRSGWLPLFKSMQLANRLC